jgi:hypothetical protein
MGTENACEPGTRCDLALNLEATVTEALRDSIHNFATVTDDGVAWR